MNTNYLKDFVPYEQALALKKLGFGEPCLAKYSIDIAGETIPHFRYNNRISQAESIDEGVWFNHNNLDKDHIWSAPTFLQAFRWLYRKLEINGVMPLDEESQIILLKELIDRLS